MQAWRHAQPSGTNSPETPERGIPAPPRKRMAAEEDREHTGCAGPGTGPARGTPSWRRGSRFASGSPPSGTQRPACRACGSGEGPPGGARPGKAKDQGGDSTGAPPLPIPNREVKPRGADGTAKAGEQVTAALEAGRTDESLPGRLSFRPLLPSSCLLPASFPLSPPLCLLPSFPSPPSLSRFPSLFPFFRFPPPSAPCLPCLSLLSLRFALSPFQGRQGEIRQLKAG